MTIGGLMFPGPQNVMYLELRNPIAHELAQDKITSARPEGYLDPAVVKTRAGKTMSVDVIDSLPEWYAGWPVVGIATRPNGRKRYVLDCGALYWAIKKMTTSLSMEIHLHREAIVARQMLDAGHGLFHLTRLSEKLLRWANVQKEIRRVWIHGSRVTGSNDLGSEVAIAVELQVDGDLEMGSLADRSVRTSLFPLWEKELSRLIRLPISLDEHRESLCKGMCGHVGSGARLAFDRIAR